MPEQAKNDSALIDIHDELQVRYWTHALQVDQRTLKATVAAVGYSSDAVRERLASSSWRSPRR